MNTIYQTLQADGRFKSIVAGIDSTGLKDLLEGETPLTVFAPTDTECEVDLKKRGTSCAEVLADNDLLTKLIRCHIVEGEFPTRILVTTVVLNPLNGRSLMVEYDKGVKLNGQVRIIEKNITCSNGILHVVDGMLCPKGQLNPRH